MMEHDPVNHPRHYNSHPSGIECIVIAEHFDFCLGNAIKYIWRASEKGDVIENLRKARWYLDREIERLEGEIRRHEERQHIRSQWYKRQSQSTEWLQRRRDAAREWRRRNPGLSTGAR